MTFRSIPVRFIVVITLFLTGCGRPVRQKPNMILILADDLGYGDTAPYG
jgi:hypothetical protein